MKRLLTLILTLLLSTTAVFAQDATEEAMSSNTIVDLASDAEGFGTLLMAVEAAGLGDTLATGEFTVFAPTNGAFETLLNDLDITAEALLSDTDLLTDVLTYHVVEGSVTFADLENLAAERNDGLVTVETVNGAEMRIQVDANEDTAVINEGAASVIQADLIASNGVIHVIDNVLMPPEEGEMTEEAMMDDDMMATEEAMMDDMMATEEAMTDDAMGDTIVDVAANTPQFDTLVAAVEAAGLADTLAEGEYTVFAPTNGAFETLLTELDMTADVLLADTELLTNVLTYHVVEGTVTSEDVMNLIEEGEGTATVETLGGGELTLSVNDEGAVVINDGAASITQVDVTASNGIIHVIDNVLLPPMDEQMMNPLVTEEAIVEEITETEEAMMDDDMMATEEAMVEEEMVTGTVVEVAARDDRFSILATAIDSAGLTDALESGEYTVFAPTDDAFENLLETTGLTAEQLLESELLDDILLYHVVEGRVPASAVTELDGQGVETLLEGNSIGVSITEDGGVVLNDVVNVTQTDITADNGVIHVIDEVLLPQVAIDELGL